MSATVMELSFRKSEHGLIVPSGFGTKCKADEYVVSESDLTLSTTPSLTNSSHAAFPLIAFSELAIRGRTFALHGGPEVTILCLTPCLDDKSLKFGSVTPGNSCISFSYLGFIFPES